MTSKHSHPENSTTPQKKPKRIDPLFNDAFIRIFGQDESRDLTRGLINAVFTRAGIEPIGEIDAISAEHTAVTGSIECKTPRMDVRIVAGRRLVDLEAQNYPDSIGNRSLYYGSQLLATGTLKTERYSELPQAVVITLLSDEPLFPESDDFVSTCRFRWEQPDGADLGYGTDRMLFVLVELRKVRDWYNHVDADVLGDEALAWAYLLTQGFADEQEMATIMSGFPSMEEFATRYGLAINDPETVRSYEAALSGEREYYARQEYLERKEREAVERGLARGLEQGLEQGLEKGLEQGLEKGLEQGLEQGRAEERARISAILREQGICEDVIAACM